VRPETDRYDQDLASLARETRRIAETIMENAIRARLNEIADELSNMASPREQSR
jgi:hypothetical protein